MLIFTRASPSPGPRRARWGSRPGDELTQRLSFLLIFPNLMLSLHPDYVVYYRVWPLAPAGRP